MPPRKSPAQIQAELRRVQQRQRQAISNYKREVDKYNRAVRKAVNDHNAGVRKGNQAIDRYNSAARTHNAKVRANRERLRREVARLNASPRTRTVQLTYRTSVERLTTSFETLERQAESQGWADSDVLEFTSAETANSVAALNALLADGTAVENSEGDVDELQSTKIEGELAELDADLDRRWRGALFALNPRNPDAARHFCTSAREMLSDILTKAAPTERVLAEDPDCERTDQGTVSRRARIRFCVAHSGVALDGLTDFVESDIDNVIALFGEFNSGTHGSAGRFSFEQLSTLKARVENAVLFLLRIAS